MSNFISIAEEVARQIAFEYECEDGIGHLIIHGLLLPENKKFSPLDKIWSSVRKRNAERHEVYTTAIFYSLDGNTIRGEFYPNHATIADQDSAEYVHHFEETFPLQMVLFIDAVQSFIVDHEFGYVAYCDYIQNAGRNASPEECGTIMDAFLRRYHYKTDKDDAEKRRRENRSKEFLRARIRDIASFIGHA